MASALDYLLDTVAPYTKSPRKRLKSMVRACERVDAEGLEGDIVECGVWRGGNIMLARLISPARACWLFDTFTGMSNRSEYDLTRGGRTMPLGKSAVSVQDVLANFAAMGIDTSKLNFVVGPVETTLKYIGDKLPQRIAVLRLDTDWFHSTTIELEVLWPRVVPGGIMIIDDYGHWLGARKAVDEYFGRRLPVLFRQIDYSAVLATKPYAAV